MLPRSTLFDLVFINSFLIQFLKYLLVVGFQVVKVEIACKFLFSKTEDTN